MPALPAPLRVPRTDPVVAGVPAADRYEFLKLVEQVHAKWEHRNLSKRDIAQMLDDARVPELLTRRGLDW